jgi:hypothetical protein
LRWLWRRGDRQAAISTRFGTRSSARTETACLDGGYYGRWLNGAELVLIEAAVLAPSAVDARARNLRGEHVAEPPIPNRIGPDYAPTAEGLFRTVDSAAASAVRHRVRAKNISPAGHTRLPRYVHGHTGVVTLVKPAEASGSGEHTAYRAIPLATSRGGKQTLAVADLAHEAMVQFELLAIRRSRAIKQPGRRRHSPRSSSS